MVHVLWMRLSRSLTKRGLISTAVSRSGACKSHRFFSSLSKWTRAIESFPANELLPPTGTGERTTRAFLGDKLLGTAAASVLMERTKPEAPSLDSGQMTKIISGAVSNSLMATHVYKILPVVNENFTQYSEWELGTMVEAAVAAVHPRDPEAVTDLATFLLEKSKQMTDPNCRGRVEELGGTVTSKRVGGSDHAPLFSATACLVDANKKQRKETAKGNSKKSAEMLAAAKILDSLFESSSSITSYGPREHVAAPVTYQEWEPMKIESFKRNLDESWETWWKRGAFDPKTAFERAMAAPIVFPDVVVAVDSWTRRVKDDPAASFMVVVSLCDGKEISKSLPVHMATTANKARKPMGVEANEWINALLSNPSLATKTVALKTTGDTKEAKKRKVGKGSRASKLATKVSQKPLTPKQRRALAKTMSRKTR